MGTNYNDSKQLSPWLHELGYYIYPKELVQIVNDYLCIKKLVEMEIKKFFEPCHCGNNKYLKIVCNELYAKCYTNNIFCDSYDECFSRTLLFVNTNNFIFRYSKSIFKFFGSNFEVGLDIQLLNYKIIKSFDFEDCIVVPWGKNIRRTEHSDNIFLQFLDLLTSMINGKEMDDAEILHIQPKDNQIIRLSVESLLKSFFERMRYNFSRKRKKEVTTIDVGRFTDEIVNILGRKCFDIVMISLNDAEMIDIEFFSLDELKSLYKEFSLVHDKNMVSYYKYNTTGNFSIKNKSILTL